MYLIEMTLQPQRFSTGKSCSYIGIFNLLTCHSVSVHIIDQIDETKNKHWYPSFCEVSTHDKHPMKMSLSWT